MTESTSPLVCYCFGHTEADLLAAQRPGGGNAVIQSITEACRDGRDRCAELNPEGRCCLGNARKLVRSGSAGSSSNSDCC